MFMFPGSGIASLLVRGSNHFRCTICIGILHQRCADSGSLEGRDHGLFNRIGRSWKTMFGVIKIHGMLVRSYGL